MIIIYIILSALILVFGIMFERYLLPILDMKLEVYNHKKSNHATKYSLLIEKQKYDFFREYPEALSQEEVEEKTPLIGFHMDRVDDEYYEEDYDNDDDCKIGLKK